LKNRDQSEQCRISSVMLFTDGLANAGLRGKQFADLIKEIIVPAGLTINTFGYGVDHDSKMLQKISYSSKGGVYYYIETVESIAMTFGECLAGLLSTVAHNIDVRFIAQDGCRIINFYTKFPIVEHKSVKDFTISMGSMFSMESKSILCKLSLRQMPPTEQQSLVQVIVSYTNSLTGVDQKCETWMNIGRPTTTPLTSMPVQMDKHINRYTAAAAIEEAITKGSGKDFSGAKKQLLEVIQHIENSVSAKSPLTSHYCDDLVEDMREVALGMENAEAFIPGIHYAHCYATMYFMERSTGSANLLGIRNVVEEHVLSEVIKHEKRRHQGYGYTTLAQEEEAIKAKIETSAYLNGYLDNVLS